MKNHDFKLGQRVRSQRITEDERAYQVEEGERFMRHNSFAGIGVGVGLLGVGASVYGANKQSKANAAANATNAELQREQNNSAWQAYLMSRGINPQGATAGNIPTTFQAINSKLPLYANVQRTSGVRRLVPRGTAVSSGTRLVPRSTSPSASPMLTPQAVSSSDVWWQN